MHRLIIKGNVHGVGFRHETNKIANELGLSGYVKNTEDGVEILVDKYEELLEKLKEMFEGYIEKIEIRNTETKEKFSDFSIRR